MSININSVRCINVTLVLLLPAVPFIRVSDRLGVGVRVMVLYAVTVIVYYVTFEEYYFILL